MSYGVNDMRDGVNLSRMQVTRPLVMHTEVTNLPNLTGFLRFGRDLPVARFKDSYNRSLTCFPAFEERTAPAVRLSPVLAAQERDVPKDPKRKLRPSSKAVASPELPLDAEIPLRADVPPVSAPVAAPQEHLPSTSGPELLGRSSGFGLTQHGRRGGMRSASRPA